MAEYRQKLIIDAQMNISNIKSAMKGLQSTLSGFKLDDKISGQLTDSFKELEKELEKYDELTSKGAKNPKETAAIEKQWQKVSSIIDSINKQSGKIAGLDPKKLIPNDAFNRVEQLKKSLEDALNTRQEKRDTKRDDIAQQLEQAKALKQELESTPSYESDYYKGLIQDIDNVNKKLTELKQKREDQGKNFSDEDKASIKAYTSELEKLIKKRVAYDLQVEKSNQNAEEHKQKLADVTQKIEELSAELAKAEKNVGGLPEGFKQIRESFAEISGKDLEQIPNTIDGLRTAMDDFAQSASGEAQQAMNNLTQGINNVTEAQTRANEQVGKMHDEGQRLGEVSSQIDRVANSITHFFSLANALNMFNRAVKQAITATKELDAAFTEIAVVSDYTVRDVWKMRTEFVDAANDIGASTTDLVSATTLYVQQGLSLEEAQKVAVETMKMGRIANLEGKDATDLMTAAIRGYKMELTDASHVNDVYSNLAAKSASDTEELAIAMSKTASTAYTSGASFENMSAFLAQIIETTREAPETAGTAMKTIISRFQELKNAVGDTVEVDGEVVSVNKVEKALATAGVALRNANGEFRAFDDVILELSSKWDSLDVMTQRYIATIAAGSRQQSRFLALLNDNERLTELVGYANDSAGASAEQFAKTQDSLQAAVNRLTNAWDLLLTGFANNKVIHIVIELLTQLLNTVNAVFSGLNNSDNILANLVGSFSQLTMTVLAFIAASRVVTTVVNGLSKAIVGHTIIQKQDAQSILAGVAARKKKIVTTIQAIAAEQAEAKAAAKTAVSLAAQGPARVEELYLLGQITDAEYDATVSRLLETKAITKEEAASMLNVGAKTAEEGATKKLTIAELKLAAARKLTTLSPLAIGLGILAATIAIIAVAVKVHNDQMNKAANAQEKLRKESEELKEEADNLKQEIDDLNSALESIDQDKEILDNLVEGSAQWYEQLVKVNDQILSIIEKYPELAQYMEVGANGELSLNQQGVEQFQEQQTQELRTNQISQMANQYKQTSLDPAVRAEQFINDASNQLGQFFNVTGSQFEEAIGILKSEGKTLATATEAEINRAFSATGVSLTANRVGQAYGYNNIGQYLSQNAADPKMNQLLLGMTADNKAAQEALRQSVFGIVTEGMSLDQGSVDFIKEKFNADFEEALAQGKTGQELVDYLTESIEGGSNGIGSAEAFKRIQSASKTGTKEEQEALQKVLDIYFGKADMATLTEGIDEIWGELGDGIPQLLEGQNINTRVLETKLSGIRDLDEKNIDTLKNLGVRDDGANLSAENRQGLLDMVSSSGMSDNAQRITAQLGFTDETFKILQDAIGDVDFTDPIQGFLALKSAMESGNPVLTEWAANMEKLGDIQIVDALSAVVNEINSADEDLASLIKTEGKIDSNKVRELAEESQYLSEMLDAGIFSAEKMAEVLTYVGEGGEIAGLTNRVVSLISAIDGVGEGYDRMMQDIEGWQSGYDQGAGVDFLKNQLDSMQKYVDDYAYGNDSLKTSLTQIFTDPIYTLDSDETRNNIDNKLATLQGWLEEDGYGFWQSASKMFQEGSEQALAAGFSITDLGGGEIEFDFSQFEGGYDELVTKIAEGFHITEEAANMMMQNFSQHSLDFKQQIEALQIKDAVEAQLGNIEEGQVVAFTTAERDLLQALGMWDEIQSKIDAVGGVRISWDLTDDNGQRLTGDALYNYVTEVIQHTQIEGMDLPIELFPEIEGVEGAEGDTGVIDFDQSFEAAVKVIPDLTEDEWKGIISKYAQENKVSLQIDGEVVGSEEVESKLAEVGSDVDYEALYNSIKTSLETGGEEAAKTLKTTFDALKLEPKVEANTTGMRTALQDTVSGWTPISVPGRLEVKAANNAQGTPANGARYSGLSFVGEEGPELYQNSETHQTYLVGTHGPELMYVNRGDRIYSNPDTKRILRNRGIPGFASGKWGDGGSGSGSSSGSGSGSSSSASKAAKEATDATEAWINAYDWLYNLVERTNEEVRRGNRLEHEREKLLRDSTASAQDLLRIYQQQMDSLIKQQQYWQEQHDKRLEEADRIEDKYSDLMQYAYYDENAGTVVINWNLIESQSGVADKEWGDRLDDYINELEDISDKIDDTEDELMDIEDQIYELQKLGQEEFQDIEQRVIKALQQARQDAIDHLQAVSDAINDGNEALLNRISDGISDYRDARESEEEKSDIEAMERRLALMQSDTSGANALDIMKLREEIDKKRESYTDSLIDKSIDEMTRQNEEAYEQRQKQIDLMQAQLDWDYERGEIAKAADEIIIRAFAQDLGLGTYSLADFEFLNNLLKDYEGYYEMGMEGRNRYEADFLADSHLASEYWGQNFYSDAWKVLYYQYLDEMGQYLFPFLQNEKDYETEDRTGWHDISDWLYYMDNGTYPISNQNLGNNIGQRYRPDPTVVNNFVVNMDNQISSDYDVERLWPQLKRAIEKESTQYNPTTLNFKNRR